MISEADKEKLIAGILRYRNDPVSFVREIFKAEPSSQQIDILEAVARPGAKVSVKSGHGTGKTTSEAWIVLWFLSTRTNAKVPCTASSQSQLRDALWSEISKWHSVMPEWWRDQLVVTAERVMVKGAESTQFAVARTASKSNPDALQGFHAENLLFIVEEASGVENKVFEVAKGALSTKGARVAMFGNPTRTTGFFFESHNKNREDWQRYTLSCEDSPHVDRKYIDNMEREYGRDSDVFRVRVLGEFPKAAFNQLISRELIEAAAGRHLKPDSYNFAPIIFGVDVAPYGGDRSAIFMRQGLAGQLLWQGVGQDDLTIAGLVAQHAKEQKPDTIFVDQGAGSGVLSALRSLGYTPIAVPFGASSGDPRFLNKRAEIWGAIKDWLKEGGAIPNNSDLVDDLAGPTYFYNLRGKLQIESKEDMKNRGLASPDLGDSLALTFSYPVTKKNDFSYSSRSGEEYANTDSDYDPLKY